MRIRERREGDGPAIEALERAAFGPAFAGRTASLLRGASAPLIARVVEAGGVLLGSVACHPVVWRGPGGLERPLLLLGPLVVDPARRGEGIGRALMAGAVRALDSRGADAVLIGDEPYYGRFGFAAGATGGWCLPGPVDPARLLLRARDPERWRGPACLLPACSARQAA